MKKNLLLTLILFFLGFFVGKAQDPGNLVWVKQLGSSGSDQVKSVKVDAQGNVYSTGSFSQTVDFDPGSGVFNLVSAGSSDVFISKLTSDGNFMWAKQVGGTSTEDVRSIALDNSGNIYVMGLFRLTADFDPGAGVFNLTSLGNRDIFILKLNASGDFVWAKQLGGFGDDIGAEMNIDYENNLYVTGYFPGTVDFDPGVGVFNLTSVGGDDIFVSKWDVNGNFIWTKKMGGTSDEEGVSIAIDGLGNVYITGIFRSTADFDPGPGDYSFTSIGLFDIFVSKLDANGNFSWAKHIGGSSGDRPNKIIIDPFNAVCILGSFFQTVDFNPGVSTYYQTSYDNSSDIFVSKLSSTGNFIWAKQIGGTTSDGASSMVLDNSGNIYIGGYFGGTADFNPGVGDSTFISTSTSNGFITKLNINGDFVWAKHLKVKATIEDICLDAIKNIYVGGSFNETGDFDPGISTVNLTPNSLDAFVMKLTQQQPCSNSSSTQTITACDSYEWQGALYTQSGTYYTTIPNATGCDSLMTLNLTVKKSSSSTHTITACNNYEWRGGIYTESGTYYDTIPNVAGCDSVIILHLTIKKNSASLENITACESYEWQGVVYTESGTYYDTILNSVGCDSLMTLNLTINRRSASVEDITACDSYEWQGVVYTKSGTYYDTISNSAGCDSIMTLNLIINKSSTSNQNITACESFEWQGFVYTQSGTYYDTIRNDLGCDSLMTLNLVINKSSTSNQNITACGSYEWQGIVYTESGTYYDTIPNSASCDSLMTLELKIKKMPTAEITIGVCDSYEWRGVLYTESGTYYDTIPNAIGCDSLMTLYLTINTTSSEQNITACESYEWLGELYTESGTYYDTVRNASGCDSLMTLNLTINRSSISEQNITACESYEWLGELYTESGTYYDTIPNSVGCDSIMTLYLIINTTSSEQTITSCESYEWQGIVYTESGTYYDTIPNSVGCDSLMTLYLTINTTSSEQIVSTCGGYEWQGVLYTESGMYYDTIPNASGCDSLMTLNLTINTTNTSVSLDGNTLTSESDEGTYQWINCDNGNAFIDGAIAQSFTATASGSYAVIITNGLCVDTSMCYELVVTGIASNLDRNNLKVFPNPTSSVVNIVLEKEYGDIQVRVLNILGEEQLFKNFYNTKELILNLDINPGVYFVDVLTKEGKLATVKVLKE